MRLYDIQKAVIQKLEAAKDVIGAHISSRISEEEPLPLVYTGEIETNPSNTKTTIGKEATQTVYVYTHSREQCFDIATKVEELLSLPLEVENARTILNEVSRVRVEQVENGMFRGEIDLRMILGKLIGGI